MATETAAAICLRCEWREAQSEAPPVCPRCGAPLYRSMPRDGDGRVTGRVTGRVPRPGRRPHHEPARAPPSSLPAAALVDPPRKRGTEAPARRGGSRWWGGLAVLCAALVGAATLTPGRLEPERPAAAEAEAPVEAVPAMARERVEVPVPLQEALEGDVRITVATMEHLPDLRSPLYRLWRIELPEGRLRPGPLVLPVRELREDPRPDTDRVAFVVRGGGLFLLEGFERSRPRWVAGGVRAFDFLPDGSLLFTSVVQRSSRCCGGTEAVVRVGRTQGESFMRGERFTRRVRSLSLQGIATSGTSAYVWGVQAGGHHLIELDLARGTRTDRHLGGLRAIGVGPRGRLLVGLRAGIGHVSLVRPDPDGAIPRVPGFLLRQILAWAPDGRTVATYGVWRGREGMWVIRLGERRPVYGTSASGPPTQAVFLDHGRSIAWAEPGYVAVADVGDRQVHRIRLPDGFPELLGAVTAG
jgi:hypothetical protein